MSTQAFDNFILLQQIMQATRNLAAYSRKAASDNIGLIQAAQAAVAASQQVVPGSDTATLGQNALNIANSVLSTISTTSAWVTANNTQADAILSLIGATRGDFSSYVGPIQGAAQALQAADKSSYANCLAALNAYLTAVSAPSTIFGV